MAQRLPPHIRAAAVDRECAPPPCRGPPEPRTGVRQQRAKAMRGEATCLGSHSWEAVKPESAQGLRQGWPRRSHK